MYEYKGNKYELLRIKTETLVQYDDKWYPAVVYARADDEDLDFIRSAKEFFNKFTRLKEE